MFRTCKTLEEAKKLYRRLSLCLHPDKGGSAELMTLLNDVYEKTKQDLQSFSSSFSIAKQKKRSKPMEPTIEKVDFQQCWQLLNECEQFYERPYFPYAFYDSLKKYLEDHEYLTIKQYKSLESIKNQFKC